MRRVDFGIIALMDHMNVDPVLAFATIARLCEIDLHARSSQDWFLYFQETGRLDLVETTVPMMRNLPEGDEEHMEGIDDVSLIRCAESSFCDLKFEVFEAAWLNYLRDGNDNYDLPSLNLSDGLVNRKAGSAKSFRV